MVEIQRDGARLHTTASESEDLLYTAVWDKANDTLVFFSHEPFSEGGEVYTSIDGEVSVYGGHVQSVALFGPKVRIIDQWIKDQIESAGFDDSF